MRFLCRCTGGISRRHRAFYALLSVTGGVAALRPLPLCTWDASDRSGTLRGSNGGWTRPGAVGGGSPNPPPHAFERDLQELPVGQVQMRDEDGVLAVMGCAQEDSHALRHAVTRMQDEGFLCVQSGEPRRAGPLIYGSEGENSSPCSFSYERSPSHQHPAHLSL